MRTRRDATVRLLRWMLAAVVAVPAAAFAYLALVTYQRSFALADERIQRSLDAVGEHAAKVFQALNATIVAVDATVRGRSDDDLRAGERALHDQLRQTAAALPAVAAIGVFDRLGHPVASSGVFPVPR